MADERRQYRRRIHQFDPDARYGKAYLNWDRFAFALTVIFVAASIGLIIWVIVVYAQISSDEEGNEETALEYMKKTLKTTEELNTGNNDIEKSLATTSFHGYRIGDAWNFGRFTLNHHHGPHIPTPLWHHKRFPHTIAGKYTKQARGTGRRDKATMLRIMDEFAPKLKEDFMKRLEEGTNLVDTIGMGGLKLKDCFDKSDRTARIASCTPGTAIAHIRIGDILGSANRDKYLITGANAKKYKEAAKRCVKDGIRRVVLVGGVHRTPKGTDLSDSVKYLKEVAAFFYEKGIKSVMMSNTPDIDLVLLCDAHYYIYNPYSGFSRMPAQLRKGEDWCTVVNIAYPWR